MIFHITFEYLPDNRAEVHAGFLETGAPPPSGVTMTGRWHCAEGNCGYLVAESPDAHGIARWLQQWTDLVSFDVTPVLTDEQFRTVIE